LLRCPAEPCSSCTGRISWNKSAMRSSKFICLLITGETIFFSYYFCGRGGSRLLHLLERLDHWQHFLVVIVAQVHVVVLLVPGIERMEPEHAKSTRRKNVHL
jgi:hypothetical protein